MRPSTSEENHFGRCGRRSRRRPAWSLPVWILLILLTRFLPLFGHNFWFDEIYSLKMALHPLRQIGFWGRMDVHPPLYYLWLRLFVASGERLGGVFASLWWLRLSSVLPGLGLLGVLWGWGRICGGRRAAGLALAVAVLTPGLCFYSQELRNYSLVMLCGALFALALVLVLERPTLPRALMLLLAGVAELEIHAVAIVYVAAGGLWLGLSWRGSRRRHGLARALLGPVTLAILATIFVGDLFPDYLRFLGFFQTHLDLLPGAGWQALPATFLYSFPMGIVEGQAWSTPYGLLCGYLVLIGAGLLLRQLRRRPQGLWRNRMTALTLSCCATLTLAYLLMIWLPTVLGLTKLFLPERTPVLVLPLWIMMMVLAVEGLSPARARRLGRAVLVGLMLPACALSLWWRWDLRDSLRPLLLGDKDLAAGLREGKDRPYLLSDQLVPWMTSQGEGVRLQGLSDFLGVIPDPSRRYALYALTGMDQLLATDRETLSAACIAEWSGAESSAKIVTYGPVTRYLVEGDKIAALQGILARRLNAVEAATVRGARRVVLPASAAEFVSAVGLAAVEFAGEQPFRWTLGSRQALCWRAPTDPGRYRVEIHFWRPTPLPTPRIDVRFRLNGGLWHRQTIGLNGVVLTTNLTTTRPGEPVTLETQMPCWIPAESEPGASDRRKLGMMFLDVAMQPETPARPAGHRKDRPAH